MECNTSVLSVEKIGQEEQLGQFLEDLTRNGLSLEEKLELGDFIIGNSQLIVLVPSMSTSVKIILDGTLKSVLIGRRVSGTAEKTVVTSCLEIHHIQKDCIENTEQDSYLLDQHSWKFYGRYVVRTTVLSPSGLTEKVVAGRVPCCIWRKSGEDGYLCLELSSPQ